MNAGDIFLYHGHSRVDRLIQRGTHSFWNHCGVIVDNRGYTVEAVRAGVELLDLFRFDPNDYRVIDTGLSPEQRTLMVATAKGFVGERYGLPTIVGLSIARMIGLPLIFGIDRRPVCSVVVAMCLYHVGVAMPKDDAAMEPGDIAALYGVTPR